ncbi:photo-regulated tyrosinase [Fomitopsis betulina]|nr:photo-regulated tyrosinase [Fomitopsis betulina]
MGQYNSHPTLRGSTSSKQVDALPTPNRLELRDFVQDTKMFSLFIQALDVLYQRPLEDKFSWAALSGIHGAPYVQWGNSGDRNPPSERPFAGYCTHGSVLFPTWHRAYVALFEQAINEVAIQIAGRYIVNAPMWLEAAKNLRVPYWDWAGPIPAGEPDIPSEITSTTVDITTSEGIKTVKNPLYWFPFPSKFPYTSFPSPHYSWGTTLRYPSSDQPNAECRMDVLSGTYAQNRNQLRTKTYNMLTRLTSWEHFSNHTAKQLPATANSLEAVHDDVHNLVGGLEPFLGHMSDTSTAAFDAVFLLHHANIDRLLSLWQAMNPEDWVTHGTQPGGTHTIEDGGTVDLNTGEYLAPFWRTQKSYWTSVDVRDWEHALNYSYPEFDGLESSSPMQIREGILDVVDKLYSPVSSLPWQRKDGQRPFIHSLNYHIRARKLNTMSAVPGTYQLQIDSPARPPINARLLHEWTIHIRFKKFELGRSYSILVHLGEMC